MPTLAQIFGADNKIIIYKLLRVKCCGRFDFRFERYRASRRTIVRRNATSRVAPAVLANNCQGYGSAESTITLTGKRFTGATAVYFGSVSEQPVAPVVVSDTQLTVTVPAPTSFVGVDILVTTNGVTSDAGASSIFTYLTPVVRNLMPSTGAPGASITINGSGFMSATSVSFTDTAGGTALTAVPKIVSDSQITVSVAAAITGSTFNVTVSSQLATSRAHPNAVFALVPAAPV